MKAFNEEVPTSFARFVGHVCGVIAVAMAALSGVGGFYIVRGLFNDQSGMSGIGFVAAGVAIAWLFFRWACVLTGLARTGGRLAVPPSVYAGFGVLCVLVAGIGVYRQIVEPMAPLATLWNLLGIISGAVLAKLCWLLVTTRRK
jgi:hypothetical protein